ncbi:uncharacterized protein [Patagioenas fasciata]|uniref:uncharacterized protein n=1 Tax=Patagioenas fasciata TaxID=372321 RepID=UPI003A99C1E6
MVGVHRLWELWVGNSAASQRPQRRCWERGGCGGGCERVAGKLLTHPGAGCRPCGHAGWSRAVRNEPPPLPGARRQQRRRPRSPPRLAAEPTVKHEPSRRAKGRQQPPGACCTCMFIEARGRAGPPGQEAAPGGAGCGASFLCRPREMAAARGEAARSAPGPVSFPPERALCSGRSGRARSLFPRSGPCAVGGPAGPLGPAPITRVRRRDARLAWKSAVKRRRCPSPRQACGSLCSRLRDWVSGDAGCAEGL